MQSPLERVATKALSLFRPPPKTTISQWAEANRTLSTENCALPGPYRLAVTPYIREILDCITDRSVEIVCCQKSAQVAWTDGVLNNAIGYYIDVDPGPMLALFPTEDMGERYSKFKLTPMIRDTPALKSKIADSKSRDSGNTMLSKSFTGGALVIAGSNAPAKLADAPMRFIFVEEPDRCSRNAGGEGSSLKLAFERTKTFHNRKIILGGSPTIKGASAIESEMENSDQRHLYIPCPHCEFMQTLKWVNVKWEKIEGRDHKVFGRHDPKTAVLECENCHQTFTNAQKNKQMAKCVWIAHAEFTGKAGFYLNELYSPFPKATLAHVVEKFLEANKSLKAGDDTLMITWTNTSMGETYEGKGDRPAWAEIKARAEPYRMLTVPMGGLFLTCGVDTQDNRLSLVVRAWGAFEESWLVYWIELYGDPGLADVWKQLDRVLSMGFRHESGSELKIVSTAIDTGGHHAHDVYNYVRTRHYLNVHAVKGSSIPGRQVDGKKTPQDVKWNGTVIKNGVQLWHIGTDIAKGIIYNRLKLPVGPGYMHASLEVEEEYFEQLTSEKLVPVLNKNGFTIHEWKKMRTRNEALDCEVYAYFAALRAGMKWVKWGEVEGAPPPEPAIQSTPTKPPSSGFFTPQANPFSGRKNWMK